MIISQEVLNSRLFWLNKLPKVSEENQHHLERYKRFILSRPLQEKEKFKHEIHHILPRSLNGLNDKNNLIVLTYREHFIAHIILWKCGYFTMTIALWQMTHTRTMKKILSSRQYDTLKKDHIILCSELFSSLCWVTNGFEEKRINVDDSFVLEDGYVFGRLNHTEDTKNKISTTLMNHEVLIETRNKIGKTLRGRNILWKEKISNTLKNRYIGGKNPNSKKVFCIELNKKFDSIVDASNEVYGSKNMCHRIRTSIKENRKVKGYSWIYG